MPESSDSERLHQEALREELEAAQRRRDSYQALLKDLPEIFEGKFRERLRPLQQRNDQLRLEGLALREQLRRILPQASGADPTQPGLTKASPHQATPPLQRRLEPPADPPGQTPDQPQAEEAPRVTAAVPAAASPRPRPPAGPARRAPWLWVGAITLGLIAMGLLGRRAVLDRIEGPDPAALPGGHGAVPAGFLRVQSREPIWLEVESSDGTSLQYGLAQGARLFPLGQGLRLRAGRPDLIRITLPGGAERVLGEVDDLEWHTIPAPRPAR